MTQTGTGTTFSLAMSVGRQKGGNPEKPLSRVDWFGLSGEEAREIVGDLVETVDGWPDHFRSAGCPDDEIRSLAPSLERLDSMMNAASGPNLER